MGKLLKKEIRTENGLWSVGMILIVCLTPMGIFLIGVMIQLLDDPNDIELIKELFIALLASCGVVPVVWYMQATTAMNRLEEHEVKQVSLSQLGTLPLDIRKDSWLRKPYYLCWYTGSDAYIVFRKVHGEWVGYVSTTYFPGLSSLYGLGAYPAKPEDLSN